jgi:hypothetical protein
MFAIDSRRRAFQTDDHRLTSPVIATSGHPGLGSRSLALTTGDRDAAQIGDRKPVYLTSTTFAGPANCRQSPVVSSRSVFQRAPQCPGECSASMTESAQPRPSPSASAAHPGHYETVSDGGSVAYLASVKQNATIAFSAEYADNLLDDRNDRLHFQTHRLSVARIP